MEEPQSLPSMGADRSEKTAETLRALREQANRTLDDHRRRISTIETELNLHVQQITEELARDRVADEREVAAAQEYQQELEHCRESLARAEEEMESLRGQLATLSAEQDAQLAAKVEEIEQLQQQLEQGEDQRSQMAEELGQLRQQLQDGEAERQQLVDELNQLRDSLSQSAAEVESLREQFATQSYEQDKQLAARAEEVEQLRQQGQQDETEQERLAHELAQLREQKDDAAQQRDRLAEELDAVRRELEALQNSECEECADGRQQLSETQQQLSDANTQLQNLQEQLQTQQEEHRQTQQSLETAEENNEKAAALLRDAEQRILELSNNDELEEQLQQTRRKFELAFADVHKLKRENAELHEELARRPETDDHESPELVSLRAERDALAARVMEAERAPSSEIDADTEQEMADLQRRFEMAVDDVRQLKQENAELIERLKASDANSSDSKVADGEALDWQAQKARLLAELDAEDQGTLSPERREERTTIEGAISITDRVVAEKDRTIAELQAQLEAKPDEASPSEVQQAVLDEMFDQDEVIQAERERLQQLQQQWREKLREAELEISVQRATLAREQAALNEKLAKLSDAESATEETSREGKPRRRWLSALGLKDDDQE